MEEYVPRTPWRRRRASDSPRPAGRGWARRLRRGGSLARRVLVGRTARRRSEAGGIRFAGAAGAGSTELRPLSDDVDPHSSPIPVRRAWRARRSPADPLATTLARGDEPVATTPISAGNLEIAPPLAIPLLPGERTLGRRLRFALVSGCTIASLLLGVSAIFIAVSGGAIPLAAICLLGCVVFDGLDGALARRLGVASPFGAQMDSLADMCSFGVAAPVVTYGWLVGAAPKPLLLPACALVAVCSAIRLARFNVSPKNGRFFCGVPTTMAAAVLALATMAAPAMSIWVTLTGVVVLALAMVSSFPYVKLARLLRLPPWLLVLPVVGALIDYQVTFATAVSAYLISGPLLWLRQRRPWRRVRLSSAR
jgi:CDP-diacylglycerol---serine O-phosphatidyltransferase